MRSGEVLNLIGTWKHNGDGLVLTFKLGKRCATRALLLQLESDKDKPFDLDEAMARLGWVRAPQPAVTP